MPGRHIATGREKRRALQDGAVPEEVDDDDDDDAGDDSDDDDEDDGDEDNDGVSCKMVQSLMNRIVFVSFLLGL